MTQHYELMFMIPGSVEETVVPAIKQRLLGLMSEFGGTITSQYDMGRRRLAFQIKQQTHGHYHVAQFDIDVEQVIELDKKLRLDHEVLRYLMVKARPMTEAELKDMIDSEPDQPVDTVVPANQVDDVAGALPVKTTTPVFAETPAAEVSVTEPASEPVSESVGEPVAESTSEPASEPVPEPVIEEKPEPKMSIEDLDKQLDAILEDTDLESKL